MLTLDLPSDLLSVYVGGALLSWGAVGVLYGDGVAHVLLNEHLSRLSGVHVSSGLLMKHAAGVTMLSGIGSALLPKDITSVRLHRGVAGVMLDGHVTVTSRGLGAGVIL